jgi:hypothetical protein
MAERKESIIVTSASVTTLVLGLLGLVISLVPCFGASGIYLSLPALLLGIGAVILASIQKVPKTFAFAATTVALLGSVFAFQQLNALERTARSLEEANREMAAAWQRATPSPSPAATETTTSTPAK